MSIGKTIVSYRSLTKPFPDVQTLLAKSREAAGKVILNPAVADARVSALAAGLQELQAAQGNFPQVLHTPRNVTASLLQSHVARNAAAQNKLEPFVLKSIESIFEGFEVKFSSDDWFGWMLSFFTWTEGLVKAGFPSAPEQAVAINNNFSVAVLGDWGTGLYGAPFCAQSIADDPDGYNLLLHMGDVYYSGLADEVEERFSKFWPSIPNAIGRSLNGNHEMYTGGHGYFEDLLPKLGQTSSYFAFQNDHWTLAALDSAYDQPFGGQIGDLNDQQVRWLRDIIEAAGNRRVVLFTHHQPYTLLDKGQGTLLAGKLNEFLQAGQIFAWYWGHEHRCVLYDQCSGFYGRCVGHGGFPEARVDLGAAPGALGSNSWRRLEKNDNAPGGLILDTANVYIPGFEAQFGPHGYMRLDFQDQHLNESVRAADGANIYDQRLI